MDQMSDTYFVGIVFEGLRSLPRPLGKSLCFKSQQQMDHAISGTGQIQKIGQLKLESHFQSGARANSSEMASQQNMRQNFKISIGFLY
jgi:hypothetical protein